MKPEAKLTPHVILRPGAQTLRTVVDGESVALIVNGRLVTRIPWEAAREVAKAIHQASLVAEEQARALQIAHDNALLLNAGFPIGLTDRKDILQEAIQEARHLPGGIRSQSVVGRPRLIKHRPPNKE